MQVISAPDASQKKPSYPYLARLRSGDRQLVLVCRHYTIAIETYGSPGNGWSGEPEHLFEPLPVGAEVTLRNT